MSIKQLGLINFHMNEMLLVMNFADLEGGTCIVVTSIEKPVTILL